MFVSCNLGLEIPKGLTAPCAPEELSNRRFYDGMIGPTWMVNATGYGHADLLEPGLVDLVDELKYCAFHEGGDPDEVYRRFLGGSVVSFAKGGFTSDPFLPSEENILMFHA